MDTKWAEGLLKKLAEEKKVEDFKEKVYKGVNQEESAELLKENMINEFENYFKDIFNGYVGSNNCFILKTEDYIEFELFNEYLRIDKELNSLDIKRARSNELAYEISFKQGKVFINDLNYGSPREMKQSDINEIFKDFFG